MKKRHKHKGTIIGVAWYRKDQWDLLKKITNEPEIPEDTYEEWLENAKEQIHKLELSGITVKKVDLDVDDVVKWCKQKHVSINSNSIAEYAAFKLKELEK